MGKVEEIKTPGEELKQPDEPEKVEIDEEPDEPEENEEPKKVNVKEEMPEWAKQTVQSLNKLIDVFGVNPPEKPVEVPIPPTPKQTEQEEKKQEEEKKPSGVRAFLKWLA